MRIKPSHDSRMHTTVSHTRRGESDRRPGKKRPFFVTKRSISGVEMAEGGNDDTAEQRRLVRLLSLIKIISKTVFTPSLSLTNQP